MPCNILLLKRVLFPLLALFFSNLPVGYAQYSPSLKEKLLGSWNSQKVSLSKSQQDTLQLGTYLQFKFTSNKVFVSTSPFDQGKWYYVKYETNSFYLISENKERIVYKIDSLNNQFLRLATEIIGDPNKYIYLSFLNATHPSFIPTVADTLVEYPIVFTIIPPGRKLIIPGLPVPKGQKNAQTPLHFNYHYSISNETKSYFPSPRFKHKSFSTLGHFLVANFNRNLLPDLSEDEYLCSFLFNPYGETDNQIRILMGSDFVINNHLYELLADSIKYWSYSENIGNSVPIQLTFLIKRLKD